MGLTACPVCTLFLREGISLEEHLETHPKDQVIEAFVNSIRHRESELHSVTNGYSSQSLHLPSNQFYDLPSQCLPLHPYQSNSITYQQMLPQNSSAGPPISSPYVPVTMLMASNGTNQPALMQMICNPYNVMQMQQSQNQQPVQLLNSRTGEQNQSSGSKSISTLSSSSHQLRKPTDIKSNDEPSITAVPSSCRNQTSASYNVDVLDNSSNPENLSSEPNKAQNNSTVPNLNTMVSRLQHTNLQSTSLPNGTQNSIMVSKSVDLPIFRKSATDSVANNYVPTNRVHVIRVLPSPEICDPKLNNAPLSQGRLAVQVNEVPLILPGKIAIPHIPCSEATKSLKSQFIQGSLASTRTGHSDFNSTTTSDKSPIQASGDLDVSSFDNLNMENTAHISSHNILATCKSQTSSDDCEDTDKCNQQNCTTKVHDSTLPGDQLDRSTPLDLERMDMELSRITLTDLGNKPCGSKYLERVDTFNNNHDRTSDDLPLETTNVVSQGPKSPTLRVRTDLSKPENKDDTVNISDSEDEHMVHMHNPAVDQSLENSLFCQESGFQGSIHVSDDSISNQNVVTATMCNLKSVSPDFIRSVSPVNEMLNCGSNPKSVSPGLRIRTDLSSLPAIDGSFKRERSLRAQNLLDQLNSNEGSTILGMVRNSLEIQPPPVSIPNSDEYITSDCTYNEEEANHRLILKQNSSNTEPKSEMSSTPLKSKQQFFNASQSGTSEEVSFEPSSPVNIIEIDGIHIIVPRQFYEDQNDVFRNTTAPTQQSNKETEGHTDAAQEIMSPKVNLDSMMSVSPRVFSKKNDDTDVSTSYDLLARESWAASDGSDTEVNADCNVSTPIWEEVSEKRPSVEKRYGKGKVGRAYKCIICGETFNCPKERRVHCSTHHSEKTSPIAMPPPSSELVKSNEQLGDDLLKHLPKKHSIMRQVTKKVKKLRTGCQVLFVRNGGANFMGVFVKENGEENKMEAEGNEDTISVEKAGAKVENPSIHNELKAVKEEKKDDKSILKVEKHIQCMTCSEMFPSKKHLQQHVRLAHNGGEWKHMCDKCQEVFTTELLYNEHLRVHPLECKQCSKNFFRRQNLLLHMKRHLGIKPHKCNMCPKSFVTKQKLSEHQNTHTGSAPIKCPLCTMSFRRYSNLIQHKNRFHYKIKKKIKDFVCFCGDIFHSRKKLDWHKEIHDEKPKCCPSCSERFVHTASLTRHIRRAHNRRYMAKVGREAENVECTICGHVFLKSSLLVHMRLHSGEKPFSCAVCGKSFATKWNLQQHRWVHASRSVKPYKCNLCKGAFTREGDYAQHMDAHRNKRPYTCNVCGEHFVRKANCRRHMKEHETGKAFFCNECGKSFHRGYYLKDHMRVHTGVRPHVCHICGKASSTKSNHNKHVKIHHAREPVNTES